LKRWLVLVLALAAGVGLAHPGGSEAQVTTCLPGPGILLLDGVTMTYTARSGDANDVQIVKTGGTYTPPNTNGIPLTQATYRISDAGAGGFNSVELECASDPSATCVEDPNDAAAVICTAIIEEFDVFVGDLDDAVDVTGVPAPTSIAGGPGNDVRGGDNVDTIGGGDGEDELHGGPGMDVLSGGLMGDHLDGGTGEDTLRGDSGNDSLQGGPGHDTLAGGSETDTLDYSDQLVDVTVDLQAAAAGGTTSAGPNGDLDTISNDFENVAGGSGNDSFSARTPTSATFCRAAPATIF